MPNRRTDYEGIITFYHILNKTRELLPSESARLAEVVQRRDWSEAQRKYRDKNKERLNEKRRLYWQANPEERNANARKWRAENGGRVREASRVWRARNPEKVKISNAKRGDRHGSDD